MVKSGIYAILNTVNNKTYVGSTVSFKDRWRLHNFHLFQNTHHSKHLQAAWNKYWYFSFLFVVIEYCEKAKLIEREQFWIDELKPEYNILPKAGTALGRKYSDEIKLRMRNRRHSLETRAKMSAWQIGRKLPEETKLKLSKARIGIKVSAEARAKMSIARKGKRLSEEHKLKISIATTGVKKIKRVSA